MTEPSAVRRWSLHVALAAAGVLPTALHPGHTVGDGVDAFGTVWFYWWVRRCVERLGDPSWTDLFFHPDGKDIFADTGNNFVDAVLSVPFQWVFGPTFYTVVFVFLLQLGNVVAFRGLAVELWGATRTAFVATLLWQASPWILFEITAGRPTQGMAWFLPVAVMYALRVVRGGRLHDGAWLGVAVAVAGWTYWFSGFFLVFLLAPLVVGWLWAAPAPTRGRAIAALGVGVVVCAAIVLPAAIPMLGAVDAGRVPGVAGAAEGTRALANNVSKDLHGLWLMETQGAPLFTSPAWGIPLLLALVWPRVRAPAGRLGWAVAFVVVIVLALGAGVPVSEATTVENPVYLALYRHLPFFDRLWFPYRFASVAFIPAVVLIAAWWERVGARSWLAALLVIASVGGLAARGEWPFRHHDARPPAALDVVEEAPGFVLFLPLGIQHDGLCWQTFFGRPTFGGMGESAAIFWPDGYRRRLRQPFVKALGDAARKGAPGVATDADRAEVLGWGMRWIVLRLDLVEERGGARARAPALDAVRAVVGHDPSSVGEDVVVWRLDAATGAPVEPR